MDKPDIRERVKATLSESLSAKVYEKAQRLDLSANQVVNLAVDNALTQMDATTVEPAQFIRNYRRITGRDLLPIAGPLWKTIAQIFPVLEKLRERNIAGTEEIFVQLWYHNGGCETEKETRALWDFAVQRFVNKLAKEKAESSRTRRTD